MLVSVAMLSGLILADRAAAWMIGEFPTSAMLWELRFEFLRPIGAFYELARLGVGELSAHRFAGIVLIAAAFIGIAAMSRVRLLRALATHALCVAAIVLWACSLEYREGIYAPAGSPSTLYALVGVLLALPTAFLCLKTHAEYVGWNPIRSNSARRARIALRRAYRRAGVAMADGLASLDSAVRPTRGIGAPQRSVVSVRSRR